MESLKQELDRKNKALKEYYKALYNEDDKMIEDRANEYISQYGSDFDIDSKKLIIKAFIDGWKYSIVQPPVRSIHLISMYAFDDIPDFIDMNMKHTTSMIKDIFRKNICPLVNDKLASTAE